MAVVKWYEAQVRRTIGTRVDNMLDNIAFGVLAAAKQNIEADDLIDTGFLLNSGYAITPKRDTHGDVITSARLPSSRTGKTVYRFAVIQPPTRRRGSAIVGFAADYAIYPELQRSYLYRALDRADIESVSMASGER